MLAAEVRVRAAGAHLIRGSAEGLSPARCITRHQQRPEQQRAACRRFQGLVSRTRAREILSHAGGAALLAYKFINRRLNLA